MKIKKKNRFFKVGKKKKIKIFHKANIFLKNNQLITFCDKKQELDIVKKNWGYYLPSINSRMRFFDYKSVLVENLKDKKKFLLIVSVKKIKLFNKYLKSNDMKILNWF